MSKTKKTIQVFNDGRQALVMGDWDFKFNNKTEVERYEVEMSDKQFEKMMEKPDKIKVDKIKNKKKIKTPVIK